MFADLSAWRPLLLSKDLSMSARKTYVTAMTLKPPVIICANPLLEPAYLREGVYLGESVAIGPNCEIKSSIICSKSCVAHFNFISDSLIGHNVNFEAGSLTANH